MPEKMPEIMPLFASRKRIPAEYCYLANVAMATFNEPPINLMPVRAGMKTGQTRPWLGLVSISLNFKIL